MTKAGHGLRHLLPAAAMTEWAIGTVAVDRGVDDARPKRRDLLRPEAELADHARAGSPGENTSASSISALRRAAPSLREIEEAAALAVVGVEDMLGDLRQALGSDHQHVGCRARRACEQPSDRPECG